VTDHAIPVPNVVDNAAVAREIVNVRAQIAPTQINVAGIATIQLLNQVFHYQLI
jgi:hypothetical protein